MYTIKNSYYTWLDLEDGYLPTSHHWGFLVFYNGHLGYILKQSPELGLYDFLHFPGKF